MDENKICFILCANDDILAGECERYIWQLNVPEGYQVDVIMVKDAACMCAGYNEAMRASDAKYKVYLHQDVLIINKNFIFDVLILFLEHPDIGMLGMVGNLELSKSGCPWEGEQAKRIGEVLLDMVVGKGVSSYVRASGEYQEVIVVDGLLVATQHDIPWREDLFQGWDFYDCSQSIEFWRQGYHVVVPYMDTPWCFHDNDAINLENYDRWREVFLAQYGDDIERWNRRKELP